VSVLAACIATVLHVSAHEERNFSVLQTLHSAASRASTSLHADSNVDVTIINVSTLGIDFQMSCFISLLGWVSLG
jgi:hypothetical protein